MITDTAYNKIYKNEKVQELKEKLNNYFQQDLKSNKKEIEVLLYFIDEEFEDKDTQGGCLKYMVNKDLFLNTGFTVDSSLKTALEERNKANGQSFKDFRDLMSFAIELFRNNEENDALTKIEIIRKFLWNKNAKQQKLYIKKIDDIECLFTKVKLSNKTRKRLFSGRYMLDINSLVSPRIDITKNTEESTDKVLVTKLIDIRDIHLIVAMFIKYVGKDWQDKL